MIFVDNEHEEEKTYQQSISATTTTQHTFSLDDNFTNTTQIV
jgi:hypothetical protein